MNIDKDIFFSRQGVLSILEKRLAGLKDGFRQNIAILGRRSIGKTTLLENFLLELKDNEIIPIYLNLDFGLFEHLIRRFFGTLLYQFQKNKNTPIKKDLNYLINQSSQDLPNSISKIKQIQFLIEKKKLDESFSGVLDLLSIFNQESGKSVLVIIDEFQRLEEFGIRNIYNELRKKILTQKNIMYILSSSARQRARKVLSGELSLLFGNFEIIEIDLFDLKECQDFIEQATQSLNFPQNLRNYLIEFTGGEPYYLKIICKELIKNVLSLHQDSISMEIFSKTLRELLFMPEGYLNQIFSQKLYSLGGLERRGEESLRILFFISTGYNKLKDISSQMHRRKKDILKKISHLLELDILDRCGDFFKVSDRVFNFWLRSVYMEKLSSLDIDRRLGKASFDMALAQSIEEFNCVSGKDFMERIIELFSLFDDDAVKIDKRRFRLSHFREIRPLKFKGSGIKRGIIGRAKDVLWVTALKEGRLSEGDIIEFACECKRYKHIDSKRILIAMNEVELNARLRALQEKIWTWNISYLNYLLSLYSRPMIIP